MEVVRREEGSRVYGFGLVVMRVRVESAGSRCGAEEVRGSSLRVELGEETRRRRREGDYKMKEWRVLSAVDVRIVVPSGDLWGESQ